MAALENMVCQDECDWCGDEARHKQSDQRVKWDRRGDALCGECGGMRDATGTTSCCGSIAKELLVAGWIGSWSGKKHYFMPGMSTSECGQFTAEDETPRERDDPGARGCGNCRKVTARFSMKVAEAVR